MATNDTIQRQYKGISNKDLAALALGTSTTETSFSLNGITLGSAVAFASAPAILQAPAQGQVVQYWDNGRPFLFTAWGTCVTGASTNLTLKLYQCPATLLPGGSAPLGVGSVSGLNAVGASTARAVNTTTGKFLYRAILQWDSTSKLIHGQFSVEISDLVDVFAASTAVTTATALDTELNFILSATLSSGNAANIVNLMEQTIQPL